MIVRILSEGQYQLPGAQLDQLNDLDNQVVDAVAANDQEGFKVLFGRMLKLVREQGQPLPLEIISESQIILPDADTTMDEARLLFTGEGLIPG
ncbi:MAG: hypothetical protein Q7O66_05405 [Dehalococcoidia bacterium]|nr:hypothetical protein [Dehalococcoidia bacterium]